MMVLALAMIPLIIVPLIVNLSPSVDRALLAIDYLVWAAFAVEYVVKLYLAPDRWRFVKANIPDLVILVVPMLRPLRVLRATRLLRLLRLVRLVAFAIEGLSEVRGVLRRRGLSWVLLIALALNLIAAALVLSFERDMPNSNIHSYPDALWWAVTTITTVGYGDRFPMSPAGRGVAVVLMVSGIALFGETSGRTTRRGYAPQTRPRARSGAASGAKRGAGEALFQRSAALHVADGPM